VDFATEMKTMAQGVVQRRREAAVRRARAKRRVRRQQIANKMLRYGVRTAAVGAAGYGATKLGGIEQAKVHAKARFVKPRHAEQGIGSPDLDSPVTNSDDGAGTV
jgi:hypothetical protein